MTVTIISNVQYINNKRLGDEAEVSEELGLKLIALEIAEEAGGE